MTERRSDPDLYGLARWGAGFLSAEGGRLRVHPRRDERGVALEEVVAAAGRGGLEPPILVRFPEILGARLDDLRQAFAGAIAEHGYRGGYQPVYPIKVNQDRHVVEAILEQGGSDPAPLGLEAGSKPELLVAAALLDDPAAPLVCNGYKDREYVETALDASRIGRRVVLVAENPGELRLILDRARAREVAPRIGLRVRLAAMGAGRWEGSSGERSKFGFSSHDLVEAVELLREEGMLDRMRLLHFHLGSQVSSVRAVHDAVAEAGWVYVQLARMGAALRWLDVGGGLGVDYTGAASAEASSMNYELPEYARVVVATVAEICDRAGVRHPDLLSESGRAMTAHHSVLVVEAVASVGQGGDAEPVEAPVEVPAEATPAIRHLETALAGLDSDNYLRTYHDAVAWRDECLSLFRLGHLTLGERALAGRLHRRISRAVLAAAESDAAASGQPIPGELSGLGEELAQTYLCNFSIFQSLPDSWAVGQLFPVAPLHRLDDPDRVRASLADLTCDSDGKIDRFPTADGDAAVVPLPRLEPDRALLLGIFLVGAYQEILGDLHNLFGDTHIVHVRLAADEPGFLIEEEVAGDRTLDVLQSVRYDREGLMRRLRRAVRRAVDGGRLGEREGLEQLDRYEAGLMGYPYLERD